jgi:hypothetical protein
VTVAVLVELIATLITGHVSNPVVLVAMLLLGAAETFADTTSWANLPVSIDKRDLGGRPVARFLDRPKRLPDEPHTAPSWKSTSMVCEPLSEQLPHGNYGSFGRLRSPESRR